MRTWKNVLQPAAPSQSLFPLHLRDATIPFDSFFVTTDNLVDRSVHRSPASRRPTPSSSASADFSACLPGLADTLHDQRLDRYKDQKPSSALGFVFVGTHEFHPVDRDVLLLDGLLHAVLVLPEALGARVAAAVPLQELLSEPAVETLVVLPLQVGTRFADAVHLRRHAEIPTRRRNVEDFLRPASLQRHAYYVTLPEPR